MKNLTKSMIILLMAGIFSSCGDSPEPTPNPPQVENKFTMAGVDYSTTHCYFYVSFGAPYKDLFSIYLLDQEMYSNNLGAAFYTENTSHILTLTNYVSSNPVPFISDVITNGTFQPYNGRHAILNYNISDWQVLGDSSGRNYGYPATPLDNPNTNNSFVYLKSTSPGNFTISNLVIDSNTFTGTMDLTYTVMGANNEVITGTYSGVFTIVSGGT